MIVAKCANRYNLYIKLIRNKKMQANLKYIFKNTSFNFILNKYIKIFVHNFKANFYHYIWN